MARVKTSKEAKSQKLAQALRKNLLRRKRVNKKELLQNLSNHGKMFGIEREEQPFNSFLS